MVDSEVSPMKIVAKSLGAGAGAAEEVEDDAFLKFVDYAKSILNESMVESSEEPSWNWIAYHILKTCIAYSSGVTPAILLSDLSQAWNEQNRAGASKKRPNFINQLKKKHKREKLPSTVTIDSIYEKKYLSLNSVIEAVILDSYLLPGTNIYMLNLGDFGSSNSIDLYLHQRFYMLADPYNGILKKGREVVLTGCHLRISTGGSARLLPTEYFIILLDEEQDDDAMLLGAQFCSDSFSSISHDAVKQGVSYSFYTRIQSIGPLESQGQYGSLQMKQITLVDNDGVKLKFILWGEQVLLANLLSVGSMLALDRPFVARPSSSALESCDEICLEYGSATQLYLVPFVQHEEQVSVPLTQIHSQGSRLLNGLDPSQGPLVSQVTLRCDSQGSIDFSNYPFRSFIVDLRDKMTGVSLYGVVIHIAQEGNNGRDPFCLKIKDTTGMIWIKLNFAESWSIGRLGLGHKVYITGLTCSLSKRNRLHCMWTESHSGSSFNNISCLPALMNSSCLHKLSRLSDLSTQTSTTHICQVWLDQIDHCHVNTRFLHSLCGHFVDATNNGDFVCDLCHRISSSEVLRTFHLEITLADDTSKLFAWCTGQTAAELLQITPDDFDDLPEEEQMMYPSSLESERFTVAIVNCSRYHSDGSMVNVSETISSWEITRAMKI